ncbi:MAG: Zn-ribbon containing protein [archaeon]|nr:Zn-ribbon containing protein [archaeon]
MPHQCVHCGEIYSAGSRAILEGCGKCGGHFFFYIKDEQLKRIKDNQMMDLPSENKVQIEKEIREMAGIEQEDTPVILDLESVRVVGPGKFEIDIVKLFNEKAPLVYKLEEGKYIIDLSSTLGREGIKKDLLKIDNIDEENQENPKRFSS